MRFLLILIIFYFVGNRFSHTKKPRRLRPNTFAIFAHNISYGDDHTIAITHAVQHTTCDECTFSLPFHNGAGLLHWDSGTLLIIWYAWTNIYKTIYNSRIFCSILCVWDASISKCANIYCHNQSREGHGVQLTSAMMGWLMNVSIHNQAIMVDGFSQMVKIKREITRLGAKVDGNNAVAHQGTDRLPQSIAQSWHRKRHNGGDNRNDE